MATVLPAPDIPVNNDQMEFALDMAVPPVLSLLSSAAITSISQPLHHEANEPPLQQERARNSAEKAVL